MHCTKLLQITLILVLVGTIFGMSSYLRPSRVTTNCCKKVSRKPIPFHITHYKLQNALFPCVEAIVFYTSERGAFCSNPSARWVSRKIAVIINQTETGST
ncbi:C-C motif chemokine 8-like [Leucoraja erinacea]|uniref:C-C motif chemokine 8-like n=1 Tax=Leucoraja erinaceus TaxID=7782 RepID=UPI002456C641|nr:C-C motif chemokine 8-like [Leucoraja erinacea]